MLERITNQDIEAASNLHSKALYDGFVICSRTQASLLAGDRNGSRKLLDELLGEIEGITYLANEAVRLIMSYEGPKDRMLREVSERAYLQNLLAQITQQIKTLLRG